MSESWGHAVYRLPAEWVAKTRRRMEEDESSRSYLRCASPKCWRAPEYRVAYRYATGRRRRVAENRRDVCASHALKFAKKHDLAGATGAIRRDMDSLDAHYSCLERMA